MNLSGQPVQMLAGFFRIKPEEILVVHDELDFPPGMAKLKQGGGIAGHNGLKDISQRLATHDYWRLRIGVGKPPAGREGADYVLEKPPAEERSAIDAAIQKALEVLPQMLAGDMQGAMHKLHTEEKPRSRRQEAREEVPEKKKRRPRKPDKAEPPKGKGLLGGPCSARNELEVRHRGPAERRQVHALQRAHQGRDRGGELSLLHHRA